MPEQCESTWRLAELIDSFLQRTIKEKLEEYRPTEEREILSLDTPLDDVVSFAEIVDRLAICNIKIWHVKDAQARSADEAELARSAKQDVALCAERSALKRALDSKLDKILVETANGDHTPHPGEVKRYGA